MRLTALLLVAALSGCSLIRARHPDPPPLTAAPTCVSNYGVTAVDVVVVAASLIGAAYGTYLVAARPVAADGTSNVPVGVLMVTGGVGAAGLFGASAGIGIPRVGACREALSEWQNGAADRAATAAAAEAARDEQARLVAAERRQQFVEAAASFLRCPVAEVTVDMMNFAQADPLRPRWGWAEMEAHGCNLAAWCGSLSAAGPECRYPNDFYVAAAQLALETQCPEHSIQPQMQQVFTKRTWSAERGESSQISWRLLACDRAYTCTVTGGLAATVSCKAALSSQP